MKIFKKTHTHIRLIVFRKSLTLQVMSEVVANKNIFKKSELKKLSVLSIYLFV
jgi:hypothetical protein